MKIKNIDIQSVIVLYKVIIIENGIEKACYQNVIERTDKKVNLFEVFKKESEEAIKDLDKLKLITFTEKVVKEKIGEKIIGTIQKVVSVS
jgi:predicted neutral ceramidase superfamily lipid hydrolase